MNISFDHSGSVNNILISFYNIKNSFTSATAWLSDPDSELILLSNVILTVSSWEI